MSFFLSSPPFSKNLVSFTWGDAFLDVLKICPTTLVAEVILLAFKLSILDVKIWTSLEIIEEFVDILSIC